MALVAIEYFGMSGSGKTVTEAKRDAGTKIEKALDGSYTPEVIAWRGHAVLVFREPLGGWHTANLTSCEGTAIPDGIRQLYGCQYSSRVDAIRSARLHLAQMGWEVDEGVDTIPQPIIDAHERALASEWRSWAEFQIRYRQGKERGLDDCAAHSYAGRNPSRADLWQNT